MPLAFLERGVEIALGGVPDAYRSPTNAQARQTRAGGGPAKDRVQRGQIQQRHQSHRRDGTRVAPHHLHRTCGDGTS